MTKLPDLPEDAEYCVALLHRHLKLGEALLEDRLPYQMRASAYLVFALQTFFEHCEDISAIKEVYQRAYEKCYAEHFKNKKE